MFIKIGQMIFLEIIWKQKHRLSSGIAHSVSLT